VVRYIGGGRWLGQRDAPRDAWMHPAAADSAARPAFPRRRRGVRERKGKGEKEEEERGDVAADSRSPVVSGSSAGKRWQVGWRSTGGPCTG
jgi:hypothetical protein